MATAKYTIGSSVPVLNPCHGYVSHTTSIGPFVYPDSPGPPPTAPEAPPGDVTTIYADYTATSANYTIMADCSVDDAPVTVTLPPLATSDGLELWIKKIDSTANAVTIDGYESELIDNNLTYVLSNENDVVGIVGDANEPEWQVLSTT